MLVCTKEIITRNHCFAWLQFSPEIIHRANSFSLTKINWVRSYHNTVHCTTVWRDIHKWLRYLHLKKKCLCLDQHYHLLQTWRQTLSWIQIQSPSCLRDSDKIRDNGISAIPASLWNLYIFIRRQELSNFKWTSVFFCPPIGKSDAQQLRLSCSSQSFTPCMQSIQLLATITTQLQTSELSLPYCF